MWHVLLPIQEKKTAEFVNHLNIRPSTHPLEVDRVRPTVRSFRGGRGGDYGREKGGSESAEKSGYQDVTSR
jgi:hypothetical protein